MSKVQFGLISEDFNLEQVASRLENHSSLIKDVQEKTFSEMPPEYQKRLTRSLMVLPPYRDVPSRPRYRDRPHRFSDGSRVAAQRP